MQTELLLRRMRWEDIIPIHAIEKKGQVIPWSENAFRECFGAGYDNWILEIQAMIIGYIIFYVRAKECQILNFCVDPTQRGQGYGKYLLQHVLQLAKQQTANAVFLEVRISNQIALQMYRQFGFNEIGVRRDYYLNPNGTCEDALMLALQL